jgi:hypothetical protein
LIIVSFSSSISFDNRRQSGQGLVDVPTGQAFARITRNDAMNPLVDLLHAFLGADTQPGSGQKQRLNARTRPSACPTTCEISLVSSTLRPIASRSPFCRRRPTARISRSAGSVCGPRATLTLCIGPSTLSASGTPPKIACQSASIRLEHIGAFATAPWTGNNIPCKASPDFP